MDETAKKLLQDILDAVVCENAGTTDPFMYIWRQKWMPLRKRIEAYLQNESTDQIPSP